jgi:hypothetical protein
MLRCKPMSKGSVTVRVPRTLLVTSIYSDHGAAIYAFGVLRFCGRAYYEQNGCPSVWDLKW